MLRKSLIAAVTLLTTQSVMALDYPETKKVDHSDNYHGTVVKDPYRWLEDDVRNSTDVASWVEAQNKVTNNYLDKLPQKAAIAAKMKDLWNYEKVTTPERRGDRLFFRKNDGLQNQYVMMVQEGDKKPRVLLDPNSWAKDGTVALSTTVPSPSGKYLAYSIQDGGSDWRIWKVLDVDTGKELTDKLEWLKFNSISWMEDESGFFYSRFPETKEGQEFQSLNTDMAVYQHTLGDKQEKDQLVYHNADNPEWGYQTSVSDNGRWLIITVWVGTDSRYQLLIKDLEKKDAKPEFLVEGFKSEYAFIGSRDNTLYFKTTDNAPMGRVIAIDAAKSLGQWHEVIAEKKSLLDSVSMSKSGLVTHYLEDAKSAMYFTNLKTNKVSQIELPTIGTVGNWDTSAKTDQLFYSFSSFNYPNTIFTNELLSNETKQYRRPEVNFKPENFVVKQVFYTSKDGTKVPMFIAHKKGLKLDGKVPTLLYGYGGFNVSLPPYFSLTRLTWMMMGGVYAQANLRGGGEYGESWHKAGTKLQKQNVFDDFIAAGEHLIESGVTNKDKLAIYGGSNGGLLVGAVSNQRPDLFKAAIPAVGVMDMLRFQKFTAGRYWVDDYGSSDNADEFKALHAYSPYHNLKKGVDYPATLVTTADTDDRVVPGHSFKYIAALQQAHDGKDPVMIRIETRAGHGSGKPTDKVIDEYSDMWAFLAENLDMKVMLK